MASASTEYSYVPQRTSLIFPTYNPGDAIRTSWFEVRKFLHQAPGQWEVLYVCDGCSDGTEKILEQMIEPEQERVKVLPLPSNQGKGFAVRTGLEKAMGQWRIFTDVDLSYGLDGVLRVAQKLWDGHPVVIGSRLLPNSSFVVPAWLQDYAYRRRIQSSIYSKIVRSLLPLKILDTQAGLKGFSAQASWNILPYLSCDGFSFDCELLLACHHLGLETPEIPVQFVYQDGNSTTNLRKSMKMLIDLWRIRHRFRKLKADLPGAIEGPSLKKSA